MGTTTAVAVSVAFVGRPLDAPTPLAVTVLTCVPSPDHVLGKKLVAFSPIPKVVGNPGRLPEPRSALVTVTSFKTSLPQFSTMTR